MSLFLNAIAVLLLAASLALQIVCIKKTELTAYKPNDIIRSPHHGHNNYTVVKMLGHGSYGAVLEVRDDQKIKKAIKIERDLYDDHRYVIERETEFLEIIRDSQLEMPGKSLCVQMYEHFDLGKDNTLRKHIVLERLEMSLDAFILKTGSRISLSEMIIKGRSHDPMTQPGSRLSLHEVKRVGRQLLQILAFLHELKIIHTDIKPGNCMLTNSNNKTSTIIPTLQQRRLSKLAKLKTKVKDFLGLNKLKVVDLVDARLKMIDFGLAINENDRGEDDECEQGTYVYRSPEMLAHLKWSFPLDIWQAALICIELYIGRVLFYAPEGDNRRAMHLIQIRRVLEDPYLEQMLRDALSNSNPGCQYKYEIFDDNGKLKDFSRQIPNFEQLFRPLNEYNYMQNDPLHKQFFEVTKQMLRVDPTQRPTASELLASGFFADESHPRH